jgi:hypothetical protein
MIRRLDESSGNVLGWEVTDEVTEEEVRTLSEEFEAAVAKHGKVRVLEVPPGLLRSTLDPIQRPPRETV